MADTDALAAWLAGQGFEKTPVISWNFSAPRLIERALFRSEARLSREGALVVETAPHTGRAPKDRYIVDEPAAEGVAWGAVNQPLDPARYEALRAEVVAALGEVYVQDLWAGADPAHRLPVRVVSESAWHAHFARNMFIRPPREALAGFEPGFTVLHAPSVEADPEVHGTRSPTFVVLNFGRREVLIGGTRYAGEIKKSIFSALNYLLPDAGVFPMHCSANVGRLGDVALFFGLSGTGKTTLSAEGDRRLIGDDEHGWGPEGVFNFEGGCYAKVIRLSEAAEPEIFRASHRFGAVLENVVMDPHSRAVDLDDASLTENTRSSYPLEFVDNAVTEGRGGHPETVFMLTADAFGVLPPIARLTPEQATYHFLSGYTARVAGTEEGVVEPQATFSTCFGAPFMPRHPSVYAEMLRERLERHGSACWLVNTGWTGGAYGTGQRMPIGETRALVRAALDGALERVPLRRDPIFGLLVPESCPDVPVERLDPRGSWSDGADYDRAARELAARFEANFSSFAPHVGQDVQDAGIHKAA